MNVQKYNVWHQNIKKLILQFIIPIAIFGTDCTAVLFNLIKNLEPYLIFKRFGHGYVLHQ